MRRSVYCSGSIAKGTDEKRLRWTDAERRQVVVGASPWEVVFLNPDDPITAPGNTLAQFGRDMFQVLTATAVIVDARERRGLGVGVEMAAAATVGTPIVVVAPPNTQYRRDRADYRGVTVTGYVHPHVASLALVVSSFTAAGVVVGRMEPTRRPRRAFPEWLDSALDEYEDHHLKGDEPMLEALSRIDAG